MSPVGIQPSPGPYNAVNVTIYKSENSPKYTIGAKKNDSKKLKRDLPLYDPVSLSIYKHTAPLFTMSGKRKEGVIERRPGPMTYDAGNSYWKMIANRAPAYTMLARRESIKGNQRLPGPANYDLMAYNPFSNAPKYTHASKHSQRGHVFILPQDNC